MSKQVRASPAQLMRGLEGADKFTGSRPKAAGHEIFDPETSRRVLVDHAFIVAGGEITKAAKNWIGERLDASKRSQVMFMDRDDILNLFVVTNVPLPAAALPPPEARFLDDEIPF